MNILDTGTAETIETMNEARATLLARLAGLSEELTAINTALGNGPSNINGLLAKYGPTVAKWIGLPAGGGILAGALADTGAFGGIISLVKTVVGM